MRIAGRHRREIHSRRRFADLQHPTSLRTSELFRILTTCKPARLFAAADARGRGAAQQPIASAVTRARGARDLVLGEPHIPV
jgi:hypothetical protein